MPSGQQGCSYLRLSVHLPDVEDLRITVTTRRHLQVLFYDLFNDNNMDFLADFQNIGILNHNHTNETDWDNGERNPGMFDAEIA